MNAKVKTKTH